MSNDDEFGLYDDLDDAFIQPLEKDIEKQKNEELEKLALKKQYEEKILEKDNKIKELEEEINRLGKQGEKAEKNFATLCLTASSEVDRKDQMIANLRRELDGWIFRKNKVGKVRTSEKFTQTYQNNLSEKSVQTSDQTSSRDSRHSSSGSSRRRSQERRESSRERHRDRSRRDDRKLRDQNHKDSKSSRKRSRSPRDSESHRRDHDKRRRYEQKSSHGTHKDKDCDLRERLLKKQVVKSDDERLGSRSREESKERKSDGADVLSINATDSELEFGDTEMRDVKERNSSERNKESSKKASEESKSLLKQQECDDKSKSSEKVNPRDPKSKRKSETLELIEEFIGSMSQDGSKETQERMKKLSEALNGSHGGNLHENVDGNEKPTGEKEKEIDEMEEGEIEDNSSDSEAQKVSEKNLEKGGNFVEEEKQKKDIEIVPAAATADSSGPKPLVDSIKPAVSSSNSLKVPDSSFVPEVLIPSQVPALPDPPKISNVSISTQVSTEPIFAPIPSVSISTQSSTVQDSSASLQVLDLPPKSTPSMMAESPPTLPEPKGNVPNQTISKSFLEIPETNSLPVDPLSVVSPVKLSTVSTTQIKNPEVNLIQPVESKENPLTVVPLVEVLTNPEVQPVESKEKENEKVMKSPEKVIKSPEKVSKKLKSSTAKKAKTSTKKLSPVKQRPIRKTRTKKYPKDSPSPSNKPKNQKSRVEDNKNSSEEAKTSVGEPEKLETANELQLIPNIVTPEIMPEGTRKSIDLLGNFADFGDSSKAGDKVKPPEDAIENPGENSIKSEDSKKTENKIDEKKRKYQKSVKPKAAEKVKKAKSCSKKPAEKLEDKKKLSEKPKEKKIEFLTKSSQFTKYNSPTTKKVSGSQSQTKPSMPVIFGSPDFKAVTAKKVEAKAQSSREIKAKVEEVKFGESSGNYLVNNLHESIKKPPNSPRRSPKKAEKSVVEIKSNGAKNSSIPSNGSPSKTVEKLSIIAGSSNSLQASKSPQNFTATSSDVSVPPPSENVIKLSDTATNISMEPPPESPASKPAESAAQKPAESPSTANDSLDSTTKENSLNESQINSVECKTKRRSYTKEINEEGIVVLNMSRLTKKKKKKLNNC